jgi:nicotinate-nucleotide pyrophosphorylase (carboxylating)
MLRTSLETGSFTETLLSSVDVKIATWRSLLPTSKKDVLRPDGSVDEVMFLAHLSAVV